MKTPMYTTKTGKHRFQVAAPISEATYQALRKIAFTEGTTLAAQVRKACIEYVARRKPASSRLD